MRKSAIIELLNNWNFWNKELDAGILRAEYIGKLLKFIHTDKIISIIGVRRSGKSTLLRQLVQSLTEKGIDKNRTLIVNFEEPALENGDLSLLLDIYSAFLEIIKPVGKPYLFLDEVQNIEKWEKFARSINEKKEAFLVVTGSSSKMLSRELATLLTGRQLYLEILPLSFKEFLQFRGLKIDEGKDILLNTLEIRKNFREYLEWGGFPEVVLNRDEEFRRRVLLSYYEDIITRDILQRFRIKKFEKLKALAHFYLTHISSYISFNKISRFLHLPVETVRRFSSYIETSSLIFFVKRFSFSLKEQENSPRKVYSIDTGLSNSIGFKFSHNFGKVLENLVALKLKKQQIENPSLEIYYWKDRYGEREVDFLTREEKDIKLIQVCWNIENMETKERETKGLIKALKEFDLKEGIIITEDYEDKEQVNNQKIIYLPLWKWLLEGGVKKKGNG